MAPDVFKRGHSATHDGRTSVIYSLLSPDALAEEIARTYPVGSPVKCQLLKRGLNDTYLVNTRNDRYIARVYVASWRTASDVGYELDLLIHLSSKGISVSVPLPTRDGRLRYIVLASEGPRHLALFTYAQGAPLSWDNSEHAFIAGQALAAVHTATEDFETRYMRFKLDLEHLIETPLAAIRPFLAHRSEDWRYLQTLSKYLCERAEAFVGAGLEWGVCHGDLSTKNIYITADGTWTILDFDLCGFGWHAYDLAVTQWLTLDRTNPGLWAAFLSGYKQVRHLSDMDQNAVPLFYAVSRFRSLGQRAVTAAYLGELRMDDKNLDERLRTLREWITNHVEGEKLSMEDTRVDANNNCKDSTDVHVADDVSQGVMPAKATQSSSSGAAVVASRMQSDQFPACHSVLTADAVLVQVLESYAIDTPARCQLLMPGMNDTYLLSARDQRFIIRIYRANWRTYSEIAYELELLTHLGSRRVPVSVPIPGRDGSLLRSVSAPEGIRYIAMFTYAAGAPVSWTDEEHCYRAGALLATIHTASQDFRTEYQRFNLDLGYLVDAPLKAIRPFLRHRSQDWCYLEDFSARIREQAEASIEAGLDWGVCHGDFSSTGNFRVADNHSLTVFDFDLCGPGWRAYDLAPIQRAARGYKNQVIWDTFLSGYTELRRLTPVDLDAVPLFHTINRLWSFGVRASNVAKWGALFMGDWYIDSQLAFFRNWEAAHGKNR